MPAPRDRTPVLLLHGFWHGSWCWTEVLAALTGAGVRALPVDMAGHGLRARRPAALTRRLAVVTAFSGRVSAALRVAVIVTHPVPRKHEGMSTSVTRRATVAFRCMGSNVA